MNASVIVPAYNAGSQLADCLKALLAQRFSGKFEVIVVDDGSKDSTPNVALAFPAVRLVRQQNKGPAAARNLGAREAKNSILVFTDSDCIPSDTWLEEMVKPFQDPLVAGVQGAYRTRQHEWVARFTQVEIEYRYEKMKSASVLDWIGSYAAAYRAEIFLGEQGFSGAFPQASGEDPDLSYKLSKKGLKLFFNPEAIVFHSHPTSLLDYLGKKFRHAYWRVLLYQKHKDKIVRDSYTPQSLKLQLLFLLLLPVVLILSLLFPFLFLLAAAALVLFALTFLPFFFFCLSRDFLLGLFSPFVVLARDLSFLAGLFFGFMDGAWKEGKREP